MFLNVKNLIPSNYSKNARNVIQWHYKGYFFQKITKSCPAVGSFAPTPPPVIRLSYTGLLTMSPNLDILTFKHLLQTLPLQQNPSCMPNQATASDLPFCDIVVP